MRLPVAAFAGLLVDVDPQGPAGAWVSEDLLSGLEPWIRTSVESPGALPGHESGGGQAHETDDDDDEEPATPSTWMPRTNARPATAQAIQV